MSKEMKWQVKNDASKSSIDIPTKRVATPLTEPAWKLQGLYSLSGKMSYRQISWSLEAANLNYMIIASLWQ